MSLKRVATAAVFFVVGAVPLHAQSLLQVSIAAPASPDVLTALVPSFLPTSAATSTTVPLASGAAQPANTALDITANFDMDIGDAASAQIFFKTPRKRLAAFAMNLRDILYRRGGHEPSTGFDCSGFVHYVYRKTFGLVLPLDAPSQFLDGEKVSREQMKTGDLVFFHEGKRITHVGIYLDDGRFIHAPRPGKRVRVDRLDNSYWLKRFAGAKRPDSLI